MLCMSYDGIPFRVLKVDQYSDGLDMSPDEVQPLYRKIEGQFQVTISPDVLGKNDLDAGVLNPEPDIGGPRALTSDGIYDLPTLLVMVTARLQVPRKPLVFWSYTSDGKGGIRRVTIARSPDLKIPINGIAQPGNYYDRDAKAGPVCKLLWSEFETGNGSLLLGIAFETHLALCRTTANPPIILMNRWSTEVSHDEDFLATQESSGVVVFRADLMADKKLTPDMLREWYVPPVPLGCQRSLGKFGFESDGYTATWEITDTEQPTDKPGIGIFGASRVEVSHTKDFTKPSSMSAFKAVVNAIKGGGK